jgi:hypothetical protein
MMPGAAARQFEHKVGGHGAVVQHAQPFLKSGHAAQEAAGGAAGEQLCKELRSIAKAFAVQADLVKGFGIQAGYIGAWRDHGFEAFAKGARGEVPNVSLLEFGMAMCLLWIFWREMTPGPCGCKMRECHTKLPPGRTVEIKAQGSIARQALAFGGGEQGGDGSVVRKGFRDVSPGAEGEDVPVARRTEDGSELFQPLVHICECRAGDSTAKQQDGGSQPAQRDG